MDITWEMRNIRHVHLETKTKQKKKCHAAPNYKKKTCQKTCKEGIIGTEHSRKTNNSNYYYLT